VIANSQDIEPNSAIAYPQILPAGFSTEECARIVALGEQRAKRRASVDDRSDLASRDYRVSEIAWIKPDPDALWLYERISALFLRVNAAYRFDLRGLVEPLQYTVYGPGQYFDWHVDTGSDETSCRKLSLTVQLDPATGYEGGDLQFHGAAEMPPAREQGAVVFFPAYLAHRVTQVARGLRRSLVAWAYGPAFR
jgi:PKHD-type hydroxylase